MATSLHTRRTREAATSGARPTVTPIVTRRFAWGVAIVGLGLTLVLGGCGAGTAHQGNGASVSGQQTQTASANTGASTSTTTTTSSSSAAQQVLNLDQQTQNDTGTLDNAQNDANVDYSSQDTPIQP